MVSSGILKNGSIIRECNTEYRLIGTSKRKITKKNYKREWNFQKECGKQEPP